MTQILLINCPIVLDQPGVFGDELTDPPLGTLYIAAYLEQAGISVKVLDVKAARMRLVDILEKIVLEQPKVVGFSALSTSIRSAVQIAKAIKNKWGQDAPVLGLGGAHISADPTFIERFPVFDFGVVGEGEKVMLQIVRDSLSGKKVTGLFYAEPTVNLDELPFPSRHLINTSNYASGTEGLHASIVGSRGCPFRCCFCSQSVYKTKVRYRSAENIMAEMETLYDQFGGRYRFHDDTFTLNRGNIIRLCDLIKKNGRKIKWEAMTRVNCLDEEMVRLISDAGCYNLSFGVESGNERIRNEVLQKRVKDEEIFRAIKWCRQYGIQSNIFLMLGFPGETMREISDTINFGSRAKPDVMGIHLTMVFPGSELYAQEVAQGRIDQTLVDRYIDEELGKESDSIWPVYIPAGLCREDLVEAKKKAYRKFYLNAGWISRRLRWDLRNPRFLLKDVYMIKSMAKALISGGTASSFS